MCRVEYTKLAKLPFVSIYVIRGSFLVCPPLSALCHLLFFVSLCLRGYFFSAALKNQG